MSPKSHHPEGKMKFFFVCTAFILFIGCTQTPTAQKDKNIDVFEDVLRQLEKETQKQSQVYFKRLKERLEILGKSDTGWWLIKFNDPRTRKVKCWIGGDVVEGNSSSIPLSDWVGDGYPD